MNKVPAYWLRRFKGKERQQIEKEVKRLMKLPNTGYFTLLHHEGPMIERSGNLMGRVRWICVHKDTHEVLTRLKNIHYMTPKRQQAAYPVLLEEYENKRGPWAAGEWTQNRKDVTALRHYHRSTNKRLCAVLKPLLPFCSYNGKDIFKI